jgi:hypothetical protein
VARGRFITFEGIEGCGKTTQLLLLASHLKHLGVTVVTTREPGGTPLGERVRNVLLDPQLSPRPLSGALPPEAARAQLVADVIAPALEAESSSSPIASPTRPLPTRAARGACLAPRFRVSTSSPALVFPTAR